MGISLLESRRKNIWISCDPFAKLSQKGLDSEAYVERSSVFVGVLVGSAFERKRFLAFELIKHFALAAQSIESKAVRRRLTCDWGLGVDAFLSELRWFWTLRSADGAEPGCAEASWDAVVLPSMIGLVYK